MLSRFRPFLVALVPLLTGCATPVVVFDQQLSPESITQDSMRQIPVSVAVFPATSNQMSRVYKAAVANYALSRMSTAVDMLANDLKSTQLFRDVRIEDGECDLQVTVYQCQGAVRSGTPFLLGSRIVTLFLRRAESSYTFLYDFVISASNSDENARFVRKYRGVYKEGGVSFPWAQRRPFTQRVDLLRHDLHQVIRENQRQLLGLPMENGEVSQQTMAP